MKEDVEGLVAEALVAEARALDAEATKGPWFVIRCRGARDGKACGVSSDPKALRYAAGVVFTDASYEECNHIVSEKDAALMARYRTLCVQLADACERSRAEVEELRRALRGIRDYVENGAVRSTAAAALGAGICDVCGCDLLKGYTRCETCVGDTGEDPDGAALGKEPSDE